MLIGGLTHVAYHVTNMEESLRFYCDCLGLQKIFELPNDDGSGWLVYLKIKDRQFIELFYGGKRKRLFPWTESQEGFANFPPEYADECRWQISTHICFEVPDIEKVAARIKEFGYKLVTGGPLKGDDNNYECFITDPDGNLIELMQYTDEALQLKEY